LSTEKPKPNIRLLHNSWPEPCLASQLHIFSAPSSAARPAPHHAPAQVVPVQLGATPR